MSDNRPDLRQSEPLFPVVAGLCLAAMACQLPQILHPAFGLGQGFEMPSVARSLVAHGVFGNPFEPVLTGPTAAEPPLYPLFLALILKLSGPGARGYIVTFANAAANVLIAALLPRLSAVLLGEAWSGVVAALFWIAACRLLPGWDASYTMLGLIAFCLVTRQRKPPWIGGLLGGLLLLLNPASLLVIIPWLIFLYSANGGRRIERLRYTAVLLAVVALCFLPWILRNYRLWGTPVVRTNFGMTLYASNNDCAQPSLDASLSAGCFALTHPSANPAEAQLLRTLGEVEYDRLRTRDAFAWIRSRPARFRRLLLERIRQFWFPELSPPRYNIYATWALTIISLPGLVLLARKQVRPALLFLALWMIYPTMYYLVVTDVRYRYPMLWTSLLPAGYAVVQFVTPMLRAITSVNKAAPILPGLVTGAERRYP